MLTRRPIFQNDVPMHHTGMSGFQFGRANRPVCVCRRRYGEKKQCGVMLCHCI